MFFFIFPKCNRITLWNNNWRTLANHCDYIHLVKHFNNSVKLLHFSMWFLFPSHFVIFLMLFNPCFGYCFYFFFLLLNSIREVTKRLKPFSRKYFSNTFQILFIFPFENDSHFTWMTTTSEQVDPGKRKRPKKDSQLNLQLPMWHMAFKRLLVRFYDFFVWTCFFAIFFFFCFHFEWKFIENIFHWLGWRESSKAILFASQCYFFCWMNFNILAEIEFHTRGKSNFFFLYCSVVLSVKSV